MVPFGGWHGYIVRPSLFFLARVSVIPLGHVFGLWAVQGRLFWFSIATILLLLVGFLCIRSANQIKLVKSFSIAWRCLPFATSLLLQFSIVSTQLAAKISKLRSGTISHDLNTSPIKNIRCDYPKSIFLDDFFTLSSSSELSESSFFLLIMLDSTSSSASS